MGSLKKKDEKALVIKKVKGEGRVTKKKSPIEVNQDAKSKNVIKDPKAKESAATKSTHAEKIVEVAAICKEASTKSNVERTEAVSSDTIIPGSAVRHLAVKRRDMKNRGLIRLTGLPLGLAEPQLRKYFSQFGEVTRVICQRSKKTGNPKGWGWLEFANLEDAQTVANGLKRYILFGKTMRLHLAESDKERAELIFKHAGKRWYRPPVAAIVASALKKRAEKDPDAIRQRNLETKAEKFRALGLKLQL